jgi:outer membrane murein-binding lipoprotein Lpp
MKKTLITITTLLMLAGCSSPPKLSQVSSNAEANPVNNPEWIKTKQAAFDEKAAKDEAKAAAQGNQ